MVEPRFEGSTDAVRAASASYDRLAALASSPKFSRTFQTAIHPVDDEGSRRRIIELLPSVRNTCVSFAATGE